LRGVFSAAEANLLIERIRARATPSSSPINDGLSSDGPNWTLR
jgi:hypothetical protein